MFYKTIIFLQKNYYLYWIEGSVNILCIYIIYKIFLFWAWLMWFLFYVLKAPVSCGKKIFKWFLLHCAYICMSSKTTPQIFKVSFQTGNINIFFLGGVIFSRYVQLKSSFLTKITSAVKSGTYVSRKVTEN